MSDPTQTPAATAAEPHATEETQMTTPTNPAAEPQARAVETRALPQVPAPFIDSFLQRNPVNRRLLGGMPDAG